MKAILILAAETLVKMIPSVVRNLLNRKNKPRRRLAKKPV